MDLQKIYSKLEKQCPVKYKINEIIPFLYPYKELKIKALVNKSPEKTMQQIYSVFLRAIKVGYNTEKDLIKFLGLSKEDFILRELYTLKGDGFLDFISGKWLVTPQGENFLKDATILKSMENEEFSFLLDIFSNTIVSKSKIKIVTNSDKGKKLESKFKHKDTKMLDEKSQQLQDVYKEEHSGESYLIDYDKDEILFYKEVFGDFIMVEYKPDNNNEDDPFIEIRNNDEDFSLNKELTKLLQEEYPDIIYQLSDSERNVIAEIQEEEPELIESFQENTIDNKDNLFMELSIWETQRKFKEALKTTKKRILIESPWIKKATLTYLNDIESLLKNKVEVIILYGIKDNDEHDYNAQNKLNELKKRYKALFKMIHLPTHFERIGERKLVGTHRKLVIKDDEILFARKF
ncbi:MAG: hypothetical protein Q4C98_02510 [Capnocytophaga sp.]|nr:hypothetical protein [Capnocytophaga sp.]